MAESSENISFRLSAELLRKLDKEREPFGDSRGQFSRRLVIAQLLRSQDDAQLVQVSDLRQNIANLEDVADANQQDLMRAVRRLAYLFLTANHPVPADQAKLLAHRVSEFGRE